MQVDDVDTVEDPFARRSARASVEDASYPDASLDVTEERKPLPGSRAN